MSFMRVLMALLVVCMLAGASAQRYPVNFYNSTAEGCRVRIAYTTAQGGYYQSWHFDPNEDPKLPCKCAEVNCHSPFMALGSDIVQVEVDGGTRSLSYRLDAIAQLRLYHGQNTWMIYYGGSIEDLAEGRPAVQFPPYNVASERYKNVVWAK